MVDFLEKLEILIDQLILHLPSEWFIDVPFLAVLLSNPNGKYVLAGFLAVIVLIASGAMFLLVQVLFNGHDGRNRPVALQNSQKQSTVVTNAGLDGFQFFKRSVDGRMADDEPALKSIEQEMLSVRQRYRDGHMLQDVYVAETRRLYKSAKALKL